MGARDVHLAKYVARYRALYPDSALVLVETTVRHIMVSGTFARDIARAVPVIRDLLELPPADGSRPTSTNATTTGEPELLVHVFSNGGSVMLSNLYRLFHGGNTAAAATKSRPEAAGLPPHALIMDSTPGYFSYRRSIYALTAAMPQGLVSLMLRPFVHVLVAWFWFLARIMGQDPLGRVADAHNDPSINKHEHARTYMYSTVDKMVDWRHVEHHAAEAKSKGYQNVRLERFEGSAHVSHARIDEERYWRIVTETWERARVKRA